MDFRCSFCFFVILVLKIYKVNGWESNDEDCTFSLEDSFARNENYKTKYVPENNAKNEFSPPPSTMQSTILLAYANNPFGNSQILLNNSLSINFSKENTEQVTKATKDKSSELNDDKDENSYYDESLDIKNDYFENDDFFKDFPINFRENNYDDVDGKENIVKSEENTREQRSKRGVYHLYNMISCTTGCNPLIYKGYGCFCGFLGSGMPVDGIDSCCKMHDWCYNNANCPNFLEYFVPYYWKCHYGEPLCAIHYDGFGTRPLDVCGRRLCECDQALSTCLRQYACPKSRAICRSSPLRYFQNVVMSSFNN